MKKFFGGLIFIIMIVMLFSTVCFALGNKNDLANLSFNELETASAVNGTDEIALFESDIPKQGQTVADIQAYMGIIDVELISATIETLTSADDGGVFVFTSASATTVNLPDAADLTKGVLLINGDGNKTLSVNPQDTDTLKTGAGLNVGEQIDAAGVTGESANVFGSGTDVYVVTTGTWANGG